MQQGYSILEGSTIAVEAMGEFFKDWGDMTGSPDLCVMTSYQEALTYLDNAARFLGKDNKEIRLLKERIISAQERLFNNISSGGSSSGKEGDSVYLLTLKTGLKELFLNRISPEHFLW
jgi:hypothetical protein